MKRILVALVLLVSVGAFPVSATQDPIEWLGRIATAGQGLNYVGTFTYQSGREFETSRIVHRVDQHGAHERLEVLDGSPREVIRSNGEVRCVLPDQKMVIVDEAGGRRAFPARLPSAYATVVENYQVSMGELARVAGKDAQIIHLVPRDGLRYGHTLWADVASGLLLKARMVDERGEVIEQFTFGDVRIGGEIGMEALKPRYAMSDSWREVNARGTPVAEGEGGWALQSPVQGYALKSMVVRQLGREHGEVLHMVFTDGLSAVSVFVEPVDPTGEREGVGALASGPINIYKRRLGDHLVTVLGEVPQKAAQMIGDGIGPVTQ